ncbi:endoribonuclease YbeY isoform X1 [Amia ocellicauda]|uniref:endoribonuclease YbeY isoform X1 n=1 Tax=Amia ocellicauda TaxID=2972642 RepID=UPI003464CC82
MSLILRNLQQVVPLRRAPLRKRVEIIREIMRIQKFDLGLICVDNNRIQHINNTYRHKNIPTDVLSFPFYEDLKADELPGQLLHPDECNLGDIFLGVEYLMRQCEEEGRDFYNTLTVVSAHGICHLLGYKHETEEEWKQMFQKESYILNEFNKHTGCHLEPLTKNISEM